MTQLFTADWHLSHENIMKYCKRPWKTVHEMNVAIFESLQKMWKRGDTLYFLGDLSMTNPKTVEQALDRLMSMGVRDVVFVFGNHDNKQTRAKVAAHKIVSWSGDMKKIKLRFHQVGEQTLPAFLCHYPMRSWDASHRGSRLLHGHSHGDIEEHWNSLDVGIDNAFKLLGEYRPFTGQEVWEQIQRINTERPHERDSVLVHPDRD